MGAKLAKPFPPPTNYHNLKKGMRQDRDEVAYGVQNCTLQKFKKVNKLCVMHQVRFVFQLPLLTYLSECLTRDTLNADAEVEVI